MGNNVNDLSNASMGMVDIMRDLIREELSKRSDVMLCQVVEKKGEDHYDLTAVPEDGTVIRNIANMVKFDLMPGDYVYVYKINGQLNNAFICYKLIPFMPQAATVGSSKAKPNERRITLEMNHFGLKSSSKIQDFIADVNTNADGKAFISKIGTDLKDTEIHSVYVWRNGWTIGHRSGVKRESVGVIAFDRSSCRVIGCRLKIGPGFDVDSKKRVTKPSVPGTPVRFSCRGADGREICSRFVDIPPVPSGSDPNAAPMFDVDLTDNQSMIPFDSMIIELAIGDYAKSGAFNLYEIEFIYKL